MTGHDWSEYFQKQTPEYKADLKKALQTLDNDPAFQKAYGYDFKELWHIIEFPLNET